MKHNEQLSVEAAYVESAVRAERLPPRPTQHVIDDPKAAQLLLDERERRYLSYFFDAPRSVSEVAQILDEEPSKLLYRVRKLQRLGLLWVARHEARAGRPIKHYQTTAKSFVVPYSASTAADTREFLGLIEGTLRDAFYASFFPESEAECTGVAFSSAERSGDTSIQLVTRADGTWRAPGPAKSATDILQINVLALPEDEAAQLKQQLMALLEHYRTREVEGASHFMLRFGLVKLRKEPG